MIKKNNQRMCVLTRLKLDKSELIRFVIVNQLVYYDSTHTLPGRGNYLKNDATTIAQFKEKQILQKRYKVLNANEFFEKIK